jgi:DNA-binding transcriptional LysR family regulator
MNDVHLRELDLNLLVVLRTLLEEQSVTRAARRLHRTQSAISHALARLRSRFGDELLVSEGRRMRPTARGRDLAERLPRALDSLQRSLAAPIDFSPATSARTFRLAAPDLVAGMLPGLLARMAAEAPAATIELLGVGPGAAADVAEGRTDALIAPAALRAEGLRGEPLGELGWAVFGRTGHPALVDGSVAAWCSAPHLQVHTGARRGGPVDAALRDLGLTRAVRAIVPGFAMAPALLARTDLLLTVPRLALAGQVEAFGLLERPVPFPLPPVSLSLWHSAVAEHGTRWFVERVAEAFAARPG